MAETPVPLRVAVLIVAAGKGVRAGGGLPKQYRPVVGQALIARTVQRFVAHPKVSTVRVAIAPDDRSLYEASLADLLTHAKLGPWTAGGAERQESVRAGLDALKADRPDIVLIHDGVRPFVSTRLISRLIAAAAAPGVAGAIPALPVVDTLKREDGEGGIAETLDRSQLWRAQTPQAFKFDLIVQAHHDARTNNLTDDAAVAEAAGLKVALVEGEVDNIKVTSAEDFATAERILGVAAAPGAARVHVGFGFDVHRFEPGDHVSLCGVAIPHTRALQGHSDADVALHALTDALLGAIAAGDIGQHFPPSDPQWRGAPSALFVARAVELVGERGGRIENVDITIICERPKVGPHRDAMAARVAELVALPRERVNVKATTTERLGFTGREEGIAAQAVATVRFD